MGEAFSLTRGCHVLPSHRLRTPGGGSTSPMLKVGDRSSRHAGTCSRLHEAVDSGQTLKTGLMAPGSLLSDENSRAQAGLRMGVGPP